MPDCGRSETFTDDEPQALGIATTSPLKPSPILDEFEQAQTELLGKAASLTERPGRWGKFGLTSFTVCGFR
jgi:hypothetical protein